MLLMLDIYFALVLFHLAFGANIPKIPDSPPSPYLQELAGQPQVECTSSIDWKGDGYNNEDCRAAVQQLYNVEVFKHQGANFEFLAKGASPKTSHSTMTTPRRYTYGKCTVAVVTLNVFPEGSLPGQDPFSPYHYRDTDIASFQELWLAADFIEQVCLNHQRPGWSMVGEWHSLGVFIWTVGSSQDREVSRGAPTFPLLSNLAKQLNSTIGMPVHLPLTAKA